MQPAERVETACPEQPKMLELALAPPSIADGVINDVAWQLLITSTQIRHEVDPPSAAPEQRRLDIVMAQDFATRRRLSGQLWKSAVIAEGPRADDRVVAPVVACPHIPEGDAVGEHWPDQSRRELQNAGEQRRLINRHRGRLDQARLRVRL